MWFADALMSFNAGNPPSPEISVRLFDARSIVYRRFSPVRAGNEEIELSLRSMVSRLVSDDRAEMSVRPLVPMLNTASDGKSMGVVFVDNVLILFP